MAESVSKNTAVDAPIHHMVFSERGDKFRGYLAQLSQLSSIWFPDVALI